jgi:glycosyltransferase involved in cell wall biosynthesis
MKDILHAPPFITLLESGMRGWVMDGIAREAPAALNLENRTFYLPTRSIHRVRHRPIFWKFLNRSDSIVLFLHHRPLLKYHERVDLARVRVFITHIDEREPLTESDFRILAKVQRIIFQNSNLLEWGVDRGLIREKCLVAHGAISQDTFYPSQKLPDSIYALISGECKERKNPERIEDLILLRTEINFIIHGNGWSEYFDGHLPPNLKILAFDKKQQAILMRNASALVTLSKNEGGPFPVLEALASGTPVLATDTGFCREIIDQNCGVILDKSSTLDEISKALDAVLNLKKATYSSSLLPNDHSWEVFAERLYFL